jgi:hypothetical protein
MSRYEPFSSRRPLQVKEKAKAMHRRALKTILALAALALFALPTAGASAAPAPWWQIVTGSHPTNLWIPSNTVQEVQAGPQVTLLFLEGAPVACMYSELACEVFFHIPNSETAQELEEALEAPAAYGPGNVDVTEDPAASRRFLVESVGEDANKAVPSLTAAGEDASAKVLSGGSGRLVVTITNLGDAPVDGSSDPVKITDELPEGVVATGVEAFAGVENFSGPVNCSLENSSFISCTFDGTLPPYEAIEVEIPASLTGEPPVAGEAGEVTVSGGNAKELSAVQTVKVSPEPTPFGVDYFDAQVEEEGGTPATQAGGHPFQMTTTLQFNSGPLDLGPTRKKTSIQQPALPRNVRFSLPAGLVGNLTGRARCSVNDLFESETRKSCPPETAVGVASVTVIERQFLGLTRIAVPVFNLPPAPGEPARLGFAVKGAAVVVDTAVDPDNKYRIIGEVRNATQVADILASTVTIWGEPDDSSHDNSRGWSCTNRFEGEELPLCERPDGLSGIPFLRLPVSCVTPLDFGLQVEPWNVPTGAVVEEATAGGGTMSGCNQVPFDPTVGVQPGSRSAGGASGLDFQLTMPTAALLDPNAKAAEGQPKKVQLTLPEGMTVNPSQGEGLAACSPADYARETATSPPGAGCPDASKIGSIRASTPLLEEEVKGALYIATPYDNPFDSLLAVYMVAKAPERGVLVKQAGKIELDPATGQIVTTFDDLPQFPIDTFEVNLFEGDRAPLVMPSQCGTYPIETTFYPWNAVDPDNPQPNEIVTETSLFTVDQGCPSGPPSFNPDFVAGTADNSAGSYSQFNLRLTREDDEQEFKTFAMKLPKGIIGKVAGVPFCPDAGIAKAQSRTGPNGGQEELDDPSCPAASQIGRVVAGAGVGSSLSYAQGKVYLAGPFHGHKLSVVTIVTAKVGPFDLGNVVVHEGLNVDPNTAEVSLDKAGAADFPRILQGIQVRLRDIRVFVDRPEFILNPTSCERMAVTANVLSVGGLAAAVSSPFQAADCASLGLKPKLSIQLLGGTKRTATPRLKAVLTARRGDANIGRAQVTLPKSEFLEQAHIRTVCTRVQFNAGGGNGEQCPRASIYGKAKATSPLLDETLTGPVFLRSSEHELPDLVAALHSPRVDVNLLGRIDSVGGGIRTTFEGVPDAPVTKFTLEMQGGKKGLIVNSTNICKGKHKAKVNLKGQNGRIYEFQPVVKAKCGGKKKSGKRK